MFREVDRLISGNLWIRLCNALTIFDYSQQMSTTKQAVALNEALNEASFV